MWAHQVKTPIAAARLLLQTGAGGEQAAELELELFKIERYVEMVLQYLRVESPSADLVIRRCSLDEIVRQAVRRYARLFIQKQIKLELDSLHEEVLTDPKWLGFVIEQVLSNALKYTHQGQISIYMDSTSPKTLVISDTGIGIAPEDLPHLRKRVYGLYWPPGKTLYWDRAVSLQADSYPPFPSRSYRIGAGEGHEGEDPSGRRGTALE